MRTSIIIAQQPLSAFAALGPLRHHINTAHPPLPHPRNHGFPNAPFRRTSSSARRCPLPHPCFNRDLLRGRNLEIRHNALQTRSLQHSLMRLRPFS